jgi:hypothetical protein
MAVRSIIRVLLMTAVVGGAFENHASAESISFKVTFGPTASPFDTTYVFDGFDPSLGTLNDVRLHADESITASGSITNLSQYAGPWSLALTGSLSVAFTNSAGFSARTPPVVPAGGLQIPFIAPNTTYFIDPPISTADGNDVGLTPPYQVQVFEGGPVTATLHADASVVLSPPTNVAFSSSFTTSTSGDFFVVYDYTPTTVSEPSSLLLLGTSLLVLAGMTCRKKRFA